MSSKAQWSGAQVLKAVRKARSRAARLAAEHVLEESRRVVPHETGTLERSSFVDVDEKAGRATVNYDTPYAVRQHEDLDNRHDQGREAKYLEKPLQHAGLAIAKIAAKELAKAFR